MSKNIPASLVTESQKNAVAFFILLKLEFDSGEVRVHTDIGAVTFNSEVYQGVGDLASITPVKEDSELSSSSVTVALSGVNNALLTTFLVEDFHGRPATIYYGMKDPENVFIDAFILFEGFMDTDTIVSGETSTIALKLNNILSLWDRKKVTMNNNEDHQKDNPGDKFFEFVEDLRHKDYAWGRASNDDVGESAGGEMAGGHFLNPL